MKNISWILAIGILAAPVAFADKAQCEAECADTAKECEEAMLKKLGKDNKAAVGQVKKICSDAGKDCKKDCK